MTFLTLSHLKKSFGATQVVHDFNMAIEKGEFISFLGPSGCGKTTVLRMIAGFETPSGGTIEIADKDQTNLKPNHRPRPESPDKQVSLLLTIKRQLRRDLLLPETL